MPAPEIDTQESLAYTLDLRKRLIGDMLSEEGIPPKDTKDRAIFLQALDGIDRQALTVKRMSVDKGIGDKQAEAAAMMAALFADPRALRQPTEGGRLDVPELPEEIVPTRVIPGELSYDHGTDTYDKFIERTQGN